MVGEPGITVIFSRSMRSSTGPTSKTGSGSAVAPWIRQASQPLLYPNEWKKGMMIR